MKLARFLLIVVLSSLPAAAAELNCGSAPKELAARLRSAGCPLAAPCEVLRI
jgi:hypothetical protein